MRNNMGENIWIFGIALTIGAVIALSGVIVGSWIMFRGKSSQPNEKFLGGQAKGEVFSISDGLDEPEFKGEVFSISDGLDEPEFPGAEEPTKAEKQLLKRTGDFLKTLSGGKG
jgi:hypothetical protein